MEFRADINGLRFLAVAAVTLFHFNVAGFSGGFTGVDIFFVVSGYLMTKILVGDGVVPAMPIMTFYVARARRIVPAVLLLCGVMYAIAALTFAPYQLRQFSSEVISAVGFYSNFFFFTDAGYFADPSKSHVLLHTWSLSVEWQFYLLYPPMLLLTGKALPGRRWLLIAICTATALSFAMCVVLAELRPIAAFYLIFPRAWELLAGGMVFLTENRLSPVDAPRRRIMEWAGLALIAVAVFGFDEKMQWPGALAVVPVLGTALVLMARCQQPTFSASLFAQAIGKWSYSIYLWHWPIVVYLHRHDIAFTAPVVTLGIAVSVLAGAASFCFVEQPVRKGLQGKGLPSQFALLAAGVAALAVPAAAGRVDGFRDRFGRTELVQLKQYEDALDDWGYPAGCGRTNIWGQLRTCTIDGKGDERVLFIGDSQVEQWWPKLANNGKGLGPPIVLATYGGCPPLPGVNRITPGFRCPEFMKAVEVLAMQQDVGIVVFGAAWPDYFLGAYGAHHSEPSLYEASGSRESDPIVVGGQSFKSAIAAFGNFISKLKAHGKRVVVLLPVPGRAEDVTKAMYFAYWNNKKIPDFSINATDYRKYAAPVVEPLVRVAQQAGAETVDPMTNLCVGDTCPMTSKDGMPLYRDGTHLRPKTVLERAAFLDDIFKPKVGACIDAPCAAAIPGHPKTYER